jgi:hypothetical protein
MAIIKRRSPEAAATGAVGVARFRIFAGLSVPCAAAGHAPASDRHRPVQIRLVQAERGDPRYPQSGLLEAGPERFTGAPIGEVDEATRALVAPLVERAGFVAAFNDAWLLLG